MDQSRTVSAVDGGEAAEHHCLDYARVKLRGGGLESTYPAWPAQPRDSIRAQKPRFLTFMTSFVTVMHNQASVFSLAAIVGAYNL